MFFKNLLIYHINAPSVTAESLAKALEEHRAKPCGRLDSVQAGFASPFDGSLDGMLVHAANGNLMVCMQIESKVLPASVVSDALSERVEEIENRDSRKVYKKERDQLKDEVLLDLLPRAFVKREYLSAFIAADRKFIVINTARRTAAEDMLARLRAALGTLPSLPLQVKADASDEMTRWVNIDSEIPAGFSIGRACELRNPLESSSVIRCKDVDLDSEEVQQCLGSGMRCTKLAMDWSGKISFLMGDDLSFRGVRFGDVLAEQVGCMDFEDKAAHMDAEFALMAGTVSEFIKAVREVLGTADGPEQLDFVGDGPDT